MNYKGRLNRIRDEMNKREISVMFLHYGANLWYLTGVHRKPPNQTDSNAYGDYICGAYISIDDKIMLVAPRMGGAYFENEAKNKPWITEIRILDENEQPKQVMTDVLNRFHLNKKGISMDDRSWMRTGLLVNKIVPNCKMTLSSKFIDQMRMIKDNDEINLMKKIGKITDEVYKKTIEHLKIGITEYEVSREIDYQFIKQGSDYPSFITGVTFSKPNKTQVAGISRSTNRRLEDGDSVTFDFGTCYQGYCSDFGRTAFVGEPPTEFKKIHDIVMNAQDAAIKKMVSETITATQLDNVARTIIEKSGYGKNFTHRLGHGIGVTVHEPPFLYPPDNTVLVTGMTFTIEPSIRLKNSYGCRVEDVVMVTDKGGVPFSNFHKELTII